MSGQLPELLAALGRPRPAGLGEGASAASPIAMSSGGRPFAAAQREYESNQAQPPWHIRRQTPRQSDRLSRKVFAAVIGFVGCQRHAALHPQHFAAG